MQSFYPKRPTTWLVLAVASLLMSSLPSHEAHAKWVPVTYTNIDSQPQGASVFLVEAGGAEKLIGLTPLKRAKLPRGMVTLKLVREGHDPFTTTIEITRVRQTLVYPLQRTILPGRIEVMSSSRFAGAAIQIDGKPVGAVPAGQDVPPGRHHVVVRKEGFHPWERWVEVVENGKVTFDIVMTAIEAPRGTLLVSSNPSGADVRVNAAPRGKTPLVVDALAPGDYLVELTLDGHLPVSNTVTVVSGQQAVVDVKLASEKSRLGRLKVVANTDEVEVSLDGVVVGKAPLSLTDITPGSHVLEGKSSRNWRGSKVVEVVGGEELLVRLELERPVVTTATVRVISPRTDLEVTVNGQTLAPPYVRDDLVPGQHVVVVRAPGLSTWQQVYELKAGDVQEVLPDLVSVGRLSLSAIDDEPAEVYLGETLLGRTPLTVEVPVGPQVLRFKRLSDGTEERAELVVGQVPQSRRATFGEGGPREATHIFSKSARTQRAGEGHVSFGLGYPELLQLAAGGGVADGFDLELRLQSSFHVITTFEGRIEWNPILTKSVAASLEGGIGLGLGGDDRSAFFGRVYGKGSLFVGDKVAFTLRLGVSFYSDRLGPESEAATADRDTSANLLVGLAVEARLSEGLNFYIELEGNPLTRDRGLYNVDFLDDWHLYPAAGVELTF